MQMRTTTRVTKKSLKNHKARPKKMRNMKKSMRVRKRKRMKILMIL
jgi:hypothetical protein